MRRTLGTYLGLYALLIAANVPLALGWVPPNRWYGFRFPGAQLAPHVWYEINALGGKMFIAGLVLCLMVNVVLVWKSSPALLQLLPWVNISLILLTFWMVTTEILRQLPG